jgi:hypothetical protein
VRAVALLGASSAAIHQLRYAIAYGDASPQALGAHGHGYLGVAMPVIVAVALLALGVAMTRLARGRRGGTQHASLPALWLGATLALAAVYGAQETLEGAGAIAGSGWIGLALAIPAGLLIALALRGAEAAEALALRLPLRFTIVADALTRLAPSPGRGRIFSVARSARAPPLASFV